MKKFRFSLGTVLDYQQKTLDSLQIEYGLMLSNVRQQEELLESVRQHYVATNEEFRERKRSGLTIAGALSYEMGLQVLEQERLREQEKLNALRLQEAALHAKLIESKVDTSSLELLRDKKLRHYQHELQKQDEHFIDDLVGFARLEAAAAMS